MTIDALKQLDERIQSFLDRAEKLRKENESLSSRLAEAEKKLGEVAAQLKQHEVDRRQFEHERGEIRTRIEKLLQRMNGIDLS
ncbi:MAG TPA: cell division protein ZapB [Candidatus Binataceae bacterium]|jgi:chromosome segregation ATPase